jgi:hypothetical protein
MNSKLNAIAAKAASDLQSLIKESEEKIMEAWNACADEAQENDTTPKFKLGLSITLDLDADKMESALSFSIRRKLTVESSIPDPNQPELLSGGASDTDINDD